MHARKQAAGEQDAHLAHSHHHHLRGPDLFTEMARPRGEQKFYSYIFPLSFSFFYFLINITFMGWISSLRWLGREKNRRFIHIYFSYPSASLFSNQRYVHGPLNLPSGFVSLVLQQTCRLSWGERP